MSQKSCILTFPFKIDCRRCPWYTKILFRRPKVSYPSAIYSRAYFKVSKSGDLSVRHEVGLRHAFTQYATLAPVFATLVSGGVKRSTAPKFKSLFSHFPRDGRVLVLATRATHDEWEGAVTTTSDAFVRNCQDQRFRIWFREASESDDYTTEQNHWSISDLPTRSQTIPYKCSIMSHRVPHLRKLLYENFCQKTRPVIFFLKNGWNRSTQNY